MSWIMKTLTALAMAFGFSGVSDTSDTKSQNPAAQTVTIETLGVMLEDAGFAVEPQVNDDGTITGYKIELVSGEQMIPVYFQVSDDRKSVTITAELTPIRDLETVPAFALAGLLQQNNLANTPFVIGMNEHFVITMQFTKPLTGLTADDLYMAIDKLQETIDLSAELWYLDSFVGTDWNPEDPIL